MIVTQKEEKKDTLRYLIVYRNKFMLRTSPVEVSIMSLSQTTFNSLTKHRKFTKFLTGLCPSQNPKDALQIIFHCLLFGSSNPYLYYRQIILHDHLHQQGL